MSQPLDTSNRFIVVRTSGGAIRIGSLPVTDLSRGQALCLAAWLVALAEPGEGPRFEEVLKAVQG